jgi:hypothetical protein
MEEYRLLSDMMLAERLKVLIFKFIVGFVKTGSV